MSLKSWCKTNLWSLLIILSVISGLICGFILKSIWTISPVVLAYIGLPGKLLIRAFMMLIVPLLVASLSTSIASSGGNKRLIITTFVLIVLFSSFAAILGTFLVHIIKPGDRSDISSAEHSNNSHTLKHVMTSQDEAIYDILMNLIPDNIIGATFMSHYTALKPIDPNDLSLGYKKVAEKSFKPNMLGLCVFSLILGFAVLHLGPKAQTIKDLLEELKAIVMNIILSLIKIMPIGMFCWMCVEAIKMESPQKILVHLGSFFGIALLGFAIMLLLFYPGIYFLFVRKNPFRFYLNIMPAIAVAFGSASSAITFPMTMKCMEENNHLPKQISQFVLPLGMTSNMNGAAMFYPMAALFMAQMDGLNITFQTLITLCLFAVIIAMAMPGAPGGGMVIYITFGALIGIENPLDKVVYIMTVDWLTDRLRTCTNVIGDCFLSALVEKFTVVPDNRQTSGAAEEVIGLKLSDL